jgi:hypothetical protein
MFSLQVLFQWLSPGSWHRVEYKGLPNFSYKHPDSFFRIAEFGSGNSKVTVRRNRVDSTGSLQGTLQIRIAEGEEATDIKVLEDTDLAVWAFLFHKNEKENLDVGVWWPYQGRTLSSGTEDHLGL